MASKESSIDSFADWSALPESLWLTVFSKCSPIDLLAIKDVCINWRRIASDFSLTSHLDLRSTDNPSVDFRSLLELLKVSAQHLSTLKIDGKILIPESKPVEQLNDRIVDKTLHTLMSTLSAHCKGLRRLSVKYLQSLYLPLQLPYDDLPTNLTHLSLINCKIANMFEVLSECSVKLSSLVYFNLSKNSEFDSLDCRSLNLFSSLKYLYLEQLFRVNDGGLIHINPQIITNLIAIDLEATDIKDESFEYILNNGHSLEDLYLSRTQISANFDLTKSVAKRLKVLCILNTGISSTNLRDILRSHRRLQSVNCDQSIRQSIDSIILSTKVPKTDTCLHYLTDNRFECQLSE